MPIYEYLCQSCQDKIEVFQHLRDPSLIDCPNCNQPSLVKLISAASFRLKGGGWYETDFKKEGDKKKNLATTEDTAVTAPKASENPVSAKAQAKPNASAASSSASGNNQQSSD